MTSTDAAEIGRLIGTAQGLGAEVARQRERLRELWRASTREVGQAEAKLRAVDFTINRRAPQAAEIREAFDLPPSDDELRRLRGEIHLGSGDLLHPHGDGWVMNPQLESQFDHFRSEALNAIQEAKRRVFGGGFRRDAAVSFAWFSGALEMLLQVRGEFAAAQAQAIAARSETMANARGMGEQALAPAQSLAESAMKMLPAPLQAWQSEAWESWTGPATVAWARGVYAGTLAPAEDLDLGDSSRFGVSAAIPFIASLSSNLQLVHSEQDRSWAVDFARSIILRHLAGTSAGELHLSLFDPVGLGQSAGDLLDLAEYNPSLIGGKVWSSPADINVRLAEHTAHIELVIQKYLRGAYETIAEFNQAAGEIAEPYRLLVVYDFPTGFTEESLGRLKSVMQNGPRCGVYTLLLTNSSVRAGYGVDVNYVAEDAWRIIAGAPFVDDYRNYSLQTTLQADRVGASNAIAKRVIEAVGRAALSNSESALTFEKAIELLASAAARGIRPELSAAAAGTSATVESTWWRDDSTKGLFAPIGQKGARDVAVLGFDSTDSSGTLLVGRPGSGKSVLLHSYIAGLTTLYGPDQLELYLIDFKEGVEFKAYGAEGLPHARVVAVESDREFGLSVLESLAAELSRRGELLRATGGRHSSLQALREASGQSLPRVLLIFDEFQVLFARNDKVGLAAADLLETIIRQGRGFGVHVLLSSQSLSGLDALGAHVPQLLPTRILLAAAELDQRRVLGENNDAGQYLTTSGLGILNSAGGAVEANERFKGVFIDEHERIERIRALRAKADREGFTRRPTVFEGNVTVPLDSIGVARFHEELASTRSAPIRLRVGVPMTVSGIADAQLRREAGANVLVVIRDSDAEGAGFGPRTGLAYATLTAAVASAAQSDAAIDIIDFLPVDDELDVTLEPLLDRRRISLRRRRAFKSLVEEVLDDVRARVQADDSSARPRLLVLFGVHRARDLDSEIGSLDGDAELSDVLEEILRDGPEFGVHTWIWADTVAGASRRLTSRMIRECGWRIAGKMSPDDILQFLGPAADRELRDSQLILANDDLGVLTRATGFGLPAADWLAQVAGAITEINREPTEGTRDA